jgi:hypothetical protein
VPVQVLLIPGILPESHQRSQARKAERQSLHCFLPHSLATLEPMP